MNELFAGMLLVFLDVNLEFSGHAFDVLPDFVGYLLMMRGLQALSGKSRHFEQARSLALGMMIFSAVLYAMDMLAVTVHDRFWSYCLGIAGLVCSLLIGYRVVSGVRDLERMGNRDLEGEKLRSMWLYASVIQCITYLCGWIPLVGQMGAIAALVMYICFLTAFYKTKKLYEQT